MTKEKMQLKQIKLIINQIEFSQQRIKDLMSYLTFLNNENYSPFTVRKELKDFNLHLTLHESVLINEINDEINKHKRTIEKLKESIGVE